MVKGSDDQFHGACLWLFLSSGRWTRLTQILFHRFTIEVNSQSQKLSVISTNRDRLERFVSKTQRCLVLIVGYKERRFI